MRIHCVSITYLHSCMGELLAFSTKDNADAFLAQTARELADERGDDFEPGEWAEYLDELEEGRVIEWSTSCTTLDGAEEPPQPGPTDTFRCASCGSTNVHGVATCVVEMNRDLNVFDVPGDIAFECGDCQSDDILEPGETLVKEEPCAS